MSPMRRMLARAGLAAAFLLTPAMARSAQAVGKVSNIRISTTEAGGEAVESGVVPTDATTAWALFDYADANKTKIKVVVFNNTGKPLLELQQSYSGAGTARVALSANDLVHGAARLVEVYSDNILEYAEMGADTRRVDGEIVNARTSLESDLRSLSSVLVPMDRAELTGAALESKQTIARLFPQVEAAVTDIAAIAVSDVEATRDRLEQLEPVATDLATAAGELDEEVSKLTAFTMAALFADNTAYTVSVNVDAPGGSSSAGSADLVVVPATKETNPGAALGASIPTATPWLPPTFNGIGDGGGQRPSTAVPTPPPAGTAATGRSTSAAPGGQAAATQAAVAAAGSDAKAATKVALGIAPAPGDPAAATADAGRAAGSADGSEASSAGISDPAAMGGPPAGAAGAAGSVPLPTFTVPAGSAATGGAASAGGGGPNLLVLGAGVAVLIALALWFRRRL